MWKMNRSQRRVVGVVASVLAFTSVLHGLDSGSVVFVLAVPAIILGSFLYQVYGHRSESVAIQRVERKRRGLILCLAGAAAAILIVVVIRVLPNPSPTTPTFESRLTPEEAAALEGALQLNGSDIEVTLYNGTERALTSAVVFVSVFRDGEQLVGRKYLLHPAGPALGIPPLSVGQLRADAGIYRLYSDSVAWSIVEVRGR